MVQRIVVKLWTHRGAGPQRGRRGLSGSERELASDTRPRAVSDAALRGGHRLVHGAPRHADGGLFEALLLAGGLDRLVLPQSFKHQFPRGALGQDRRRYLMEPCDVLGEDEGIFLADLRLSRHRSTPPLSHCSVMNIIMTMANGPWERRNVSVRRNPA